MNKERTETIKSHLDNVIFFYDLSPWKADPKSIYGQHLDNVLKKLESRMGNLYFEYRFLVYEHNLHQPMPEFKLTGDDVILIFISDENSTVPESISDQFFAIFKSYYPLEENHGNILAFPIGYSNSAAMIKHVPFEQRKYDASYAGNFLGNRLDFYRQFSLLRFFPPFPIRNRKIIALYFKLLRKLKIFKARKYNNDFGTSMVYWSDGFAKGLSREEYADIISNTRIALCPKGFISTECFRLMETMMIGCVIVSADLPPSRWYKDSPIIVVKDWLNIKKTVNALIQDPDKLRELHVRTLQWWDEVCSDEATAKYLAGEIERLRSEQDSSTRKP